MHLDFGQTGVSEVTGVNELDRHGCPDPSTPSLSIGTHSFLGAY